MSLSVVLLMGKVQWAYDHIEWHSVRASTTACPFVKDSSTSCFAEMRSEEIRTLLEEVNTVSWLQAQGRVHHAHKECHEESHPSFLAMGILLGGIDFRDHP